MKWREAEEVFPRDVVLPLVVVVRSSQHNASPKYTIGNTLLTLCIIEVHILAGAVAFLFNCNTVRKTSRKPVMVSDIDVIWFILPVSWRYPIVTILV